MRSLFPQNDEEQRTVVQSAALGGGLGLLGGLLSSGGGGGVALLAAPVFGGLIGLGSGFARVHEARRAADGEDERSSFERFKDGLTLVIIWAGWMFLICYAVVKIINSGPLF